MDRARSVTTLVATKPPLYDAFNRRTETEKTDFMAVLLRCPLECGLLFTLDPEILVPFLLLLPLHRN